jgi:hypothetical protein
MELKKFKIHNWNCEMNEDVRISFDIQGIVNPKIFVTVFQTGKLAIEKLQGGTGSYWDIFQPLMILVYTIQDALKKSK